MGLGRNLVSTMAATITAEDYLARVERLSKELAKEGSGRPKPNTAVPAKPTKRRST